MCSGNVASSERNPDYSEDGGFSVGPNSFTRFADLTVKVMACVNVGQAAPCVENLWPGLIHKYSSVCHRLKGVSCFPATVAALLEVRVLERDTSR